MMNTVPKLEHIEKAIEYMGEPVGCNSAAWFIGVNKRINEIALAEQRRQQNAKDLREAMLAADKFANLTSPIKKYSGLSNQQEITEFAKKRSGMEFDEWQGKPPQQESEYITAAQARELGAGNAEIEIVPGGWIVCGAACGYIDKYLGIDIKYRAIKQAQPEPVDPHAALRAEYIRQRDAVPCELGFYLWEYKHELQKEFITLDYSRFVGFNIDMHPDHNYRYTDISCYVSKDGDAAIRMLRTDAQELQRKLGDTVNWFTTGGALVVIDLLFGDKGTYTYRTKATIKLDGNMVTPEQAAAEWEAKKETHELWYRSDRVDWCIWFLKQLNKVENHNEHYELRPKQATWTGSRDDVIALLKEEGLL